MTPGRYLSEQIGELNAHKYYALDVSEFSHDNVGEKLWVLCLTETNTKEFRVVLTKSRNSNILETFVKKMIPTGNYLVIDGWAG